MWEVGRENDHIHPTQKPVELFTRPMEFHTVRQDVCAEPFSGSGSQLIAAEKMGRRAFVMELDPIYVDVAITRWENSTGKKAVLDGTTKAQGQEIGGITGRKTAIKKGKSGVPRQPETTVATREKRKPKR